MVGEDNKDTFEAEIEMDRSTFVVPKSFGACFPSMPSAGLCRIHTERELGWVAFLLATLLTRACTI